MASSKSYLDFILEQLSGLDGITWRAMMGEYILYYQGKIIGGIYDDRFLVKPTESAVGMMPDADRELPYDGAKEMLLVENVENREFLAKLVEAMAAELPAPKKKKPKDFTPAVQGIHHISMKCGTRDEFTKAKAFYCGLLGMKIIRDWSEGAMIDTGAGLIEIFCNGKGIWEKGAIRHVALCVTDVDAFAARIRSAGYHVFIEPKNIVIPSDPPLFARMAFCIGPLGEEIELFCEQEENGKRSPHRG